MNNKNNNEWETCWSNLQEAGFKLNEYRNKKDMTVSAESYEELLNFTIDLFISIKDIIEKYNEANGHIHEKIEERKNEYIEIVKREFLSVGSELSDKYEILLRKGFNQGVIECNKLLGEIHGG